VNRSANPPGRRYVALSEAAAYLGRTEKALRKLVERRAIPFRRAGRRLIFDLVELDRWVEGLPGVGLDEAMNRCQGQASETALPRWAVGR
jgi:excisionase family DNA binding protein